MATEMLMRKRKLSQFGAAIGGLAVLLGIEARAETVAFNLAADVVVDGPISGYDEAEIRLVVDTTGSPLRDENGVARYLLPGPDPLTVTFRDELPNTWPRTFSIRCAKAQLAVHYQSGFYPGYVFRGFDCVDDRLKIGVLALVVELMGVGSVGGPAPPSDLNLALFTFRDLRITTNDSQLRAVISAAILLPEAIDGPIVALLALGVLATIRAREITHGTD